MPFIYKYKRKRQLLCYVVYLMQAYLSIWALMLVTSLSKTCILLIWITDVLCKNLLYCFKSVKASQITLFNFVNSVWRLIRSRSSCRVYTLMFKLVFLSRYTILKYLIYNSVRYNGSLFPYRIKWQNIS